MNKVYSRVKRRTQLLKDSGRTLKELYEIIFDCPDMVMSITSTVARKLSLNYGEAKRDVERLALSIKAKFGSGNYVGLYGENSSKWIVLFWAILRSGNKPYLVNLRQPASFSEGILKTLNAVAVIYTSDESCPLNYESCSFDSLMNENSDSERDLDTFADEIALSTSGTTLKEKICFYTGKEICSQILNVTSIVKENPNMIGSYRGEVRMLAFLPLYHIFGLEAMYLWFAFVGSGFVFMTDMAPANILRTVRNNNVTHIFAVPLLWHAVEKNVVHTVAGEDEKLQRKFEKAKKISLSLQNISPKLGEFFAKKALATVRGRLFGDSIRFCISGGSFIKPSTLELINALGYPLYNGYGMSEVGITSVELAKKPKYRMLGSIGRPFDSVNYRIGDEGQLLIKGDSLCSRMTVDSHSFDMPEWFDTGDVVHADEDGRYYIDGRISDIVFGDDGENLNPDFTERAFHLSCANAFSVLGNEDKSKLMLVVQVPGELMEYQRMQILSDIEKCNAELPLSYQVREVRFTYDPIMPADAIKVSRAYLRREIDAGRVRLFDNLEEPVHEDFGEDSEIKHILRQMVADVLDIPVDKVSDNGHFMNDLGGTSLDYFALVSEINEKFDITLSFEVSQFGYTLNDLDKLVCELIGKS